MHFTGCSLITINIKQYYMTLFIMHGTTLKSVNNCCIPPTSFNSYNIEKQAYGLQVNYTLEIMEPHWSVYLWYIQVPP